MVSSPLTLLVTLFGIIRSSHAFYELRAQASRFGKRYALYNSGIDWYTARHHCFANGMDLVKIESAEEFTWFRDVFTRENLLDLHTAQVWIGWKDGLWADGSPVMDADWRYLQDTDCGTLFTENYLNNGVLETYQFFDILRCDSNQRGFFPDRMDGHVCAASCSDFPRCTRGFCNDNPSSKCTQNKFMVDPLNCGQDTCNDVPCHLCGGESRCIQSCESFKMNHPGMYDCAQLCGDMAQQSSFMCFNDCGDFMCPRRCDTRPCRQNPHEPCSLSIDFVWNPFGDQCLETCFDKLAVLKCDYCGPVKKCIRACNAVNRRDGLALDCMAECEAIEEDYKCWNDKDCN